MSIVIKFSVDDEAVMRGLREQRRAIGQDVKRLSLEAGQKTTLPVARSLTKPSFAARSVVIKSTTKGAYITTSGNRKLSRIVGLLNFGGTVKTPILPKNAKALKIGPDRYAARVDTPRVYKGDRFWNKAVDITIGRYSAHMEAELTKVMQSRLAYARTFS